MFSKARRFSNDRQDVIGIKHTYLKNLQFEYVH